MTAEKATVESTVKDAARHWYRVREARYLLEHGYLGPRYVEVQVTKGDAWWALDNVVLGVVANLRYGPGSGSTWRLVPADQVGEMAACFIDLGFPGRLEVRRLPTREELGA